MHKWTCACAAKAMSSASCSWWWLFFLKIDLINNSKTYDKSSALKVFDDKLLEFISACSKKSIECTHSTFWHNN